MTERDEQKRRRRLGLPMATAATAAVIALGACTQSGRAPVARGDDQVVRVIAQLETTPPEAEVARRDYLDRLAASADVDWIEFVRPMSGSGWVMNVSCNDIQGRPAPDPCAAAIGRLKLSSDVKSVERDSVLTHQ